MFFVKNLLFFLALLIALAACKGDIGDDLYPSAEDKRSEKEKGGWVLTEAELSFSIPDSLGNNVNLTTELQSTDAVVLYYTMWCPVCDSHQMHMLNYVVPYYPNVRFYLVDYLAGSVSEARPEISEGYDGSDFTVLADLDNKLEYLFDATMGITVVIDSSYTVRMLEDYKDGQRLKEVLSGL